MKLFINSGERLVEGAGDVEELVTQLGLEPKMVLVEHNGMALHRSEWRNSLLSEGDRIEILQVAAGG